MNLSLTPRPSLRLILGLALAFTGTLRAADADADLQLDPPQLDELMGPIALYPDALVALILPASTEPADIVLAARYLSTGGDPTKIDEQPWNDSIKALARYPTLVKWMDDNLTWTREVGSAFLNQPDDVMTSVQRLRTQARATGALTDTPQQQVVMEGDIIEIVPAQPDVIYVPYYDPNVVYVGGPGYYPGSYLTFGLGMPIGFWLAYDFNWRTRVIFVGDRHHNWHNYRDWKRDHRTGNRGGGNWHQWHPPVVRPPFARRDTHHGPPHLVRPSPFPGSPNFPHDNRPRGSDRHRPDADPRSGNRGHNPSPGANPPPQPNTPDNRGRRSAPTAPRPDSNPVPGQPPRPVVQPNQPPPLPEVDPRGRRDTGDNRGNRDKGPVARPPGSMPQAPRPPSVNPPRPSNPDLRGAPVPTHPDHPQAPTPTRPAPNRPEPRDVRPAPQPANPPPPPATKQKDSSRDTQPEEAR